MWKRILVSVLLGLMPVSTTYAAEHTVMEQYMGELRALVSYLERELNMLPKATLSAEEMRAVIANASAWLVRSQEESGHFRYEYAPYEDTYLDDDNIVRQAGALFELGEIIRHDKKDVLELGPTIASSIEYFEELSRADTYNDIDFRCIVRYEGSDTCKLGATALALIGIMSYVEAYPEMHSEYEELIADYIAFIKAAKIEGTNEGFRNKHEIGEDSQSEAESSFSNGEALLALARYYRYYKEDIEVAELAQSTFSYLTSTEYDSPLYLWMMAALKDMQVLWPNALYAPYASDYTNWRITDRSRFRDTKNNYCALAEGITSAYSVLKDTMSTPERAALRREIDFWNNKNLQLQIGDQDMVRYVRRGDTLERQVIRNMNVAHGGFLTADNKLTQRIDFTQHCISAYLQVLTDIEGKTL